jgi:hypothetical protein
MKENDMKLIPEWCECKDPKEGNAVYADDNTCKCGINKHHWHCTVCGKVIQVG